MKRRVLLCVLDWGLGHATRSLAVLRELEKNNCEVIVASSGQVLTFLKFELPDHVIHELPGYGVRYDTSSFEWGMILQLGKILGAIKRENAAIKEIFRTGKFDIIISDNRYGCFDASTRSVFLAHHLTIRLTGLWKVLSPLVNFFHARLINRFAEVWVPDYADRLLSGELSHSGHPNLTFVGPISTMRRTTEKPPLTYEFIAVLSGPEPARTRFSDELFAQLKDSGKGFVLVEGKPERTEPDTATRIQHLTRDDVCALIQKSKILIARSGYSTIMDMAAIGGRAIFVPTPGQSEQLYLASRIDRMGIAACREEHNFNLAEATSDSVRYKGFDTPTDNSNTLLRNAILNLISDGKVD